MDRTEKAALLRELIEEKKEIVFNVTSWSMRPILSAGDVVLIKKMDTYRRGDVIIFLRKDNFVVHRILFKIFKLFFTKGDALFFFDFPVSYDKILGKVVLIKKFIVNKN